MRTVWWTALPALIVAWSAFAQEPAQSTPSAAKTPTATTAHAPDLTSARTSALTLDSTAIRGNQELPKVLYIVPWKDPAAVELSGRPVNSLVEEVVAPVDREVFRRQTRYFSQLYGADSAQQGGGPTGGHPAATNPRGTDRQAAGTQPASRQQK
ncbi:MAG: hypothetical protein R3F24_13925 [Gammaproteobacteria bacterium]